MGLFNRESKKPLPSLFLDDEPVMSDADLDYEAVIEWLRGLSDTDHTVICKVAGIYRKADKEAREALGLADKPKTFINPPSAGLDDNTELVDKDVNHIKPQTMLDEDDDLAAAFLQDDPDTESEFIETPAKPINKIKTQKVKVKGE